MVVLYSISGNSNSNSNSAMIALICLFIHTMKLFIACGSRVSNIALGLYSTQQIPML